ncbi:MAG: TspO/MBR family protein [Candidatus Paceibacterota bacterium]|jgi:tryptophan-rich sensory protein|nr:tryptophan-rich sensory protein [Candidatus Paceibacterota bacterium]MDD5555106.1 tryptophan-rich sensory protein [Candidatus Paceibacterota bacterium]
MKINYFFIPLITIIVAYFGGTITEKGMVWYNGLNLPLIAPEGKIIGLVWTVIYVLATISALIVWNKLKHDKSFKIIVSLFIANAFLNWFWTYLFFGLHFIAWSVLEMVILNLTNLFLVVVLSRKDLIASFLLVPYFLWVCFATYLAYAILTIN